MVKMCLYAHRLLSGRVFRPETFKMEAFQLLPLVRALRSSSFAMHRIVIMLLVLLTNKYTKLYVCMCIHTN